MKMKKILSTLLGTSIIIIILVVLITLFIFGVKGFINYSSETKKICDDYYNQGYESYRDIATHKNCKLTNDTNYGFKLFYDVYNDTCRLEKEYLEEYGRNCVWGSIGYLTLVFRVMYLGVIFTFIFVTISGPVQSIIKYQRKKKIIKLLNERKGNHI